mmetsp:Transcript_44293/g.120689  ORF Transcript_44293/g.120689 Transcript_44293/m.120689 type:complete len:254 (-) Transcript_44293:85-846(-)
MHALCLCPIHLATGHMCVLHGPCPIPHARRSSKSAASRRSSTSGSGSAAHASLSSTATLGYCERKKQRFHANCTGVALFSKEWTKERELELHCTIFSVKSACNATASSYSGVAASRSCMESSSTVTLVLERPKFRSSTAAWESVTRKRRVPVTSIELVPSLSSIELTWVIFARQPNLESWWMRPNGRRCSRHSFTSLRYLGSNTRRGIRIVGKRVALSTKSGKSIKTVPGSIVGYWMGGDSGKAWALALFTQL